MTRKQMEAEEARQAEQANARLIAESMAYSESKRARKR
jgi:hypothetical protein